MWCKYRLDISWSVWYTGLLFDPVFEHLLWLFRVLDHVSFASGDLCSVLLDDLLLARAFLSMLRGHFCS